MRYHELLTEEEITELEEVETVDGEMPYKVSPFSIPRKKFIFSRATGPNGARTKDGFVKDKFRDVLDPTYDKDQAQKPDGEDAEVLDKIVS